MNRGRAILWAALTSLAGSWWQQVTGQAIHGPLKGKRLADPSSRRLTPLFVLKDYWFDWKAYHPETAVYGLGTLHSF